MSAERPPDDKTNPLKRLGIAPGNRTLVVVGGRGLEERPLPAKGTVVIGRDATANVVIDDHFVSKRHAVLHVDGGIITVVDEGSSNGTFVNGVRLPPGQATNVMPTDVIHVGSVALLFRELMLATARPASEARRLVVDPVMRRLYDVVATVAPNRVNVLLLGETGVGKEVLAAAIHERSPRATASFVRINCASLPPTLLEAELFGYERGAFTGASAPKVGLLEAAHGGTLFLDEIGEASLETQAKLLRFLETGELMRVGSVQPKFVDVRVVAATNRDLPAMVSNGAFRADFYFRLNGITLRIPPLRERRAELVPLAEEFALQAAARLKGWASVTLTPVAKQMLLAHDWPGNIRELRATIERAVLLSPASTIDEASIQIERLPPPTSVAPPPPPAPSAPSVPEPSSRRRADTVRVWDPADTDEIDAAVARAAEEPNPERDAIMKALADTAGNQSRAAELLGISRRTLVKRLDEYDVPRPRKKTEK